MNTQANAAATVLPAPLATRPLYWSVRRELWENRSLYLAPIAVAGILLLASVISAFYYWKKMGEIMRPVLALDPAKQAAAIGEPYAYVAMLLILTVFLVGFFYCLDALHGERRDRSILFWKSLPVSDWTTVLSKAAIPLVVLPLIAFTIIVVTQIIMLLLLTTVAVLARGLTPAILWTQVPLFENALVLLCGLAALALWHAPVYGWLLLVSSWAKRGTFLWAVLPPIVLCVFEWIAFHTTYLASMLSQRLGNSPADVFTFVALAPKVPKTPVIVALTDLDPVNFFSTPGLWIGLACAAVFVAAAVWMRRDREPI